MVIDRVTAQAPARANDQATDPAMEKENDPGTGLATAKASDQAIVPARVTSIPVTSTLAAATSEVVTSAVATDPPHCLRTVPDIGHPEPVHQVGDHPAPDLQAGVLRDTDLPMAATGQFTAVAGVTGVIATAGTTTTPAGVGASLRQRL